jgi:hypothetical protein
MRKRNDSRKGAEEMERQKDEVKKKLNDRFRLAENSSTNV